MELRSKARLLIADDHELVAEACKNLLEPEFEVIGIVNDGRALLRSAVELKPDVAVVDIAMPLLNGLAAGEQLKHLLPSIKIVHLTMNTDAAVAAEAFRRGASAYLPKTAAASVWRQPFFPVSDDYFSRHCYCRSQPSRLWESGNPA